MGTREKLIGIFCILHDKFGPQGWWPSTPKNSTTPKYFTPIKTKKQQFEIVLGSILTQNTSWKNVEKAIINLNKNNLIDIKKIKSVRLSKLKKLIRAAGYFNQKSVRLKIISRFLERNPNPTREELLEVKGIGPETADSILLYAFNKPYFVIDAYTKRIMFRLGYKFKSYEDLQSLFISNLDKNPKLFNEYHALLVELGKNYCTKNNPSCISCPLLQVCKFGQKSAIS